ncbi:N-6 DNA methylase [Candidatus Woesearchaeota archaeon]|jgi:type I restriction enzyme M protein|nr:N-6 DNA methylase [Candidatus Woesearchaeota archaeon]
MSEEPVSIPEGKIIDFIDGKFRKDTPEEYVRQQIEKSIVKEYTYSKEDVKVEFTIKIGSSKKRVDLVIFESEDENIQDNAWILVECKKATTQPAHKKEGVDQLKSYMASCVNSEFGLWTNGKDRFCFRKIVKDKKIEFEEIIDIPKFGQTLEEAEKPKLKDLREATGDNLKFTFRRCHDYIAGNQGLQKPEAFWELLKIIFCKIFDEKEGKIQFYVTSEERNSINGQLKLKNRIDAIFSKVIKIREYQSIFKNNETIELEPRVTAFIVSQLQNYSLLESNIDVKGAAYEEIVGANLRGDRGEFFTPRNICEMAVDMLNPTVKEKLIDPACGTGGFLVIAMNHVLKEIRNKVKKRWRDPLNPSDNERSLLFKEIMEYTENYIYGTDINPNLVKATKMNMVMNNDGSGSVFQSNSLANPHTWREEFTKKININNSKDIGKFDVVVTNPPFGTKIPIDDPVILEQFEIAYIWEKSENGFTKTTRLQKSVPPEILFIERCLQLLREGGRMAIVLPDAILGAPGLKYLRYWILKNVQVLASIDLHKDTFQPKNGTQTSVLLLRKKTKKEKEMEDAKSTIRKYPTFMAMVEHVGHDKRGNLTFKRDEKGNEKVISQKEMVKEESKGKIVEKEIETKTKITDDETTEISLIFKEWKKEQKERYSEYDF